MKIKDLNRSIKQQKPCPSGVRFLSSAKSVAGLLKVVPGAWLHWYLMRVKLKDSEKVKLITIREQITGFYYPNPYYHCVPGSVIQEKWRKKILKALGPAIRRLMRARRI